MKTFLNCKSTCAHFSRLQHNISARQSCACFPTSYDGKQVDGYAASVALPLPRVTVYLLLGQDRDEEGYGTLSDAYRACVINPGHPLMSEVTTQMSGVRLPRMQPGRYRPAHDCVPLPPLLLPRGVAHPQQHIPPYSFPLSVVVACSLALPTPLPPLFSPFLFSNSLLSFFNSPSLLCDVAWETLRHT